LQDVSVRTLAGAGPANSGNTNGNGIAATFSNPNDVATDTAGNVYVADAFNSLIRKITPSGNVTTFASTLVNGPAGIAVNAVGIVYVSNNFDNNILKITPAGIVSVYLSSIASPFGITVDSNNIVYVSEQNTNTIVKITALNTSSLFATGFTTPYGLAVDAINNVYVADKGANKILKITPGGSVTTFAGTGSTTPFLGGAALSATFNAPQGVAVDATGIVYVADTGNQIIRKIAGGQVTTLAGSNSHTSGFNTGAGSVSASAALFSTPSGLATDTNGNVFVADYTNNSIRIIIPEINLSNPSVGAATGSYPVVLNADDGINSPLTIQSFNIQVYAANTAIWNGNTDTNWNTTSNWDNSTIPTSGDDVVILNVTNKPIISSGTSAAANNITVDTGSSLTINGGGNLTVSGNLANNGTFTINSDAAKSGSLIVIGTSNTGSVTYNRYMTGSSINTADWHLIAAPVVGQDINNFVVTNTANNITISGVNYSLAPYDNTKANTDPLHWNHWTSDATNPISGAGIFIDGKGYEVHTDASGTVAFTGTVLVGNVSIPITVPVANNNPWNLIGNPFPSSILANINAGTKNFIDLNSTAMDASFQALYLWNPTTSLYDLINQTTGTTYIAPGQGFFVKSIAGGATINFTTVMRTNQPTVVFQKAATTSTPDIVLSANDGSITKTSDIKYIAGKTLGLDPGYDAGLFEATNDNFKLYTHLINDNGIKFMLQVLPDNTYNTIVPVGIDALAGTQITFKANVSNLPIGKKVFLEDRLLGVFNELNNTNKSYTITFSADTNGIGRFYLHTLDNLSTLAVDDFTKINYTVIAQPNNNSIRVIGNIEAPGKLNI